jgi:hypothetical protein
MCVKCVVSIQAHTAGVSLLGASMWKLKVDLRMNEEGLVSQDFRQGQRIALPAVAPAKADTLIAAKDGEAQASDTPAPAVLALAGPSALTATLDHRIRASVVPISALGDFLRGWLHEAASAELALLADAVIKTSTAPAKVQTPVKTSMLTPATNVTQETVAMQAH